MKLLNNNLFKPIYRKVGFSLLIIGAVAWFFHEFNGWKIKLLTIPIKDEGVFLEDTYNNFTNELIATVVLFGFLFACFSRLKVEDEYSRTIRLQCWQHAILIYMLVIFVSLFVIYDLDYMLFMIYNMFTPMIVFLILFHIKIYRSTKLAKNEK